MTEPNYELKLRAARKAIVVDGGKAPDVFDKIKVTSDFFDSMYDELPYHRGDRPDSSISGFTGTTFELVPIYIDNDIEGEFEYVLKESK